MPEPGNWDGRFNYRPQLRKERSMPSYSNLYQDYSADNEFDYGRRQPERSPQRTRRSTVRRTSTSKSSSFNGLHRRRNKHWNW
ncbi:MAG TPA: hypothetical protein VHD36_00580 [Pirellulales bacterium]|nr:hypothetical protein [Pirellulales bacterium]